MYCLIFSLPIKTTTSKFLKRLYRSYHLNTIFTSGRNTKMVNFVCSGATHSGVSGCQNQDELLMYKDEAKKNFVFGIFDGHGKDIGKLAAMEAKKSFMKAFENGNFFERLEKDCKAVLEDLYRNAHDQLKVAFMEYYRKNGYLVKQVEAKSEGASYLVKKNKHNFNYSCVHGGTTATVVIILNGKRMIVSNVGDSTALLGGVRTNLELKKRFYTCKNGSKREMERYALLSAEHSPESVSEFRRVYPSVESLNMDKMVFLYDTMRSGHVNGRKERSPIFDVAKDSGKIKLSKKGSYYKNVRNEWASLVAASKNATFHDSLSFTRSLGDFHLHAYGVSHKPDIVEYDVQDCLQHFSQKGSNQSDKKSILVVVASDGIWDNWKYSDLVNHLMTNDILEESEKEGQMDKIANQFVQHNRSLAKTHFGNSMDNMSAVLCYIHSSTESETVVDNQQ